MSIKINIVSPGRFHVCDLARELDKCGWDVKFYSFVPTKRAMKFGLPRRCSASVFGAVAPFLLLKKLVRKKWAATLQKKAQDLITSLYMRKCDVLIVMSGNFGRTIATAQKAGSKIIVERGSKHILEQKRVLESIPALRGRVIVPQENVERELRDYDSADYIAVASKHVVESFAKQGFDVRKLFKNPYGVDLSMFSRKPEIAKTYDVLMVGGWSYRKGCDLIVEAIKQTDLKFLHVGSLVDCPFPTDDKRFTHIGAVDQSQLVNYYNQAKVFVLPSREEGLAMVQAQAIACNLPLIGSKDSGAEDLKEMVEIPEYITIIEDYTPEAVLASIREALGNYEQLGDKLYAGNAAEQLTWAAYGKRYSDFLKSIL